MNSKLHSLSAFKENQVNWLEKNLFSYFSQYILVFTSHGKNHVTIFLFVLPG